jgi:hypothetical protein
VKISNPSGIVQGTFHSYRAVEDACYDANEGFLSGGLSPPDKKMTSLRPRRLRGEISILDKSG